ncbi:MAG: hypothetical protein Q9165_000704 [Trypethelium subeluteriae]
MTALVDSEIVSELLHSHDRRLCTKDLRELDELAADLGISGRGIKDALVETWEIEDAVRHLIQDLGAGSSSLTHTTTKVDIPKSLSKELTADPYPTVRRVRFGAVEEIPSLPNSGASEISEISTASLESQLISQYVDECRSDKTSDISESSARRTRICFKCSFFYTDPDPDLYPGIDEEYDFHGVCSSCIAQLESTPRKSSVSATHSQGDDNGGFSVAARFDDDAHDAEREDSRAARSADKTGAAIDKRFAQDCKHDMRLWRPRESIEVPEIMVTDVAGAAEMWWTEGEELPEGKMGGRTLRE